MILLRFALSHHLNEPVKQIPGILGPGTGLRVILHRENILTRIGKSLVGAVVYIDEGRHGHLRVQPVRVHHIAVILGGNIHSSRLQILHRMIPSPVSVLHFMSIRPRGQSHQLMPQADGEDGNLRIIKLPDLPDHPGALLGIPRPVAEHDAVRPVRNNLRSPGLRRIHRDLAAPLRQRAGDIGLGPEIQQRHPQARTVQFLHQTGPLLSPARTVKGLIKPCGAGQRSVLGQLRHRLHHILFPAGDLLHHLPRGISPDPGRNLRKIKIVIRGDHPVHGTLLPQNPGEGSGIDTGDAGHIIFFQKLLDTDVAAEIAGNTGELPDKKRIRPGLRGLHILPADAIIADEGIGHAHRLPRIGRVCQHLQVSRHGSVKHYLADYLSVGAYVSSLKHGAVLQNQKRLHLTLPSPAPAGTPYLPDILF